MTTKREMSENWSQEKKMFFIDCIRKKKDTSILENEGNDAKLMKKRKNAWSEVQEEMEANGFERSIERMKE